MATVSSLSSGQSAVQSGWQQLQLQQARRAADQADAEAQALRLQAANAERAASQADANAQTLASASNQAESNAGRARQGLALLETTGNMKAALSNTVQEVLTKQQAEQPTPATVTPQSVTNSQGQVTGTVVNVTA
jgi:hypothetical protein